MTVLRRLLLIDDQQDVLISMRMKLKNLYSVTTATSIAQGLELLNEQDADLVLLDVDLDGENGLDGIQKIHALNPSISVAMLSGCKEPSTVVAAIRAGAVDYLTKPVNLDDLASVVERALVVRAMSERCEALLKDQQNASDARATIVHRSSAMQKLLDDADHVSGHQANVLIIGETGTGKELLAKFLNDTQSTPKRPFVAVNCAALPEHLLESELFGHETGAFTGASKRRIGKFELADGGDIFLDEIGTMKLDLQAKLLRVLQEKTFSRLGSNEVIKADFRVISATNEYIDVLVENGSFRLDLYHRLRVIQLNIPPLRDRVEDIPLLIEHFARINSHDGKIKRLTPQAMTKFLEYNWPGNVRELANVIQSLVILARGEEIDVASFPFWIMNGSSDKSSLMKSDRENFKNDSSAAIDRPLKEYLFDAEKRYIERVLVMYNNDKTKAARHLGISRATLYHRLKDLGFEK